MIILFDSGLRARVSVGDPVDDGVCFSLGSLVAHGSLNWRRAPFGPVSWSTSILCGSYPLEHDNLASISMPTAFPGNLGLKRHDLGFQSRMLRTFKTDFSFNFFERSKEISI